MGSFCAGRHLSCTGERPVAVARPEGGERVGLERPDRPPIVGEQALGVDRGVPKSFGVRDLALEQCGVAGDPEPRCDGDALAGKPADLEPPVGVPERLFGALQPELGQSEVEGDVDAAGELLV